MIRLIWVLLIGVAKVFRGSPSTPFQVDELKLVYMCIISRQTRYQDKCLGAITSSQQDVAHFGIFMAVLGHFGYFVNHSNMLLEVDFLQ